MNVIETEDGIEEVSRVDFCRNLIDGVREGLEESFILPLTVQSVSNNQVTYLATIDSEDGEGTTTETEVVNINDQDDLELLFLTYIIIGSSTLTMPKVVVHFSEEDFDESGEYIVDGLELHDFTGQVITAGSTVGTLKVELGGNYLRNLIKMRGLISTSSVDAKPKILQIAKSESDIEDEGFELMFREVFEADPAYSLSNLIQRQRTKGRRQKAVKLARRSDPAEFRKRSKAAKLRWRKNRTNILRGMKKFHRSAQGKRMHKMIGKLNEAS